MNSSATLIMPDGVEIISTKTGYVCPSMPALGEVLNFMFPCYATNPRMSAERVGRRYGWRVQKAMEAIEAHNRAREGVGV